MVPVMENWTWPPLVTASSRRTKFVSERVRPGFVEAERIWDMRMGLPEILDQPHGVLHLGVGDDGDDDCFALAGART